MLAVATGQLVSGLVSVLRRDPRGAVVDRDLQSSVDVGGSEGGDICPVQLFVLYNQHPLTSDWSRRGQLLEGYRRQ